MTHAHRKNCPTPSNFIEYSRINAAIQARHDKRVLAHPTHTRAKRRADRRQYAPDDVSGLLLQTPAPDRKACQEDIHALHIEYSMLRRFRATRFRVRAIPIVPICCSGSKQLKPHRVQRRALISGRHTQRAPKCRDAAKSPTTRQRSNCQLAFVTCHYPNYPNYPIFRESLSRNIFYGQLFRFLG